MSITKETTIWCDTCGNWEQFASTAKKTRKFLKDKGWSHPTSKVDYCPQCAQKVIDEGKGDNDE